MDLKMENYYYLKDIENRGVIAAGNGRDSFQFVVGKPEGWSPMGMMDYFFPDGVKYNCYEDISEEQAIAYINRELSDIRTIWDSVCAIAEDKFINEENLEQSIVGTFILNGREFYENHKNIIASYPRMGSAIENFFKNCQLESADEILYLRIWRNIRDIALKYFEREHNNQHLSDERYELLVKYLSAEIIYFTDEQLACVIDKPLKRKFWLFDK